MQFLSTQVATAIEEMDRSFSKRRNETNFTQQLDELALGGCSKTGDSEVDEEEDKLK